MDKSDYALTDAEYEEILARIEKYARILRKYGVRNLDLREMGSPRELSDADIERYVRRLDEEERAFIRDQIEPLKVPYAKRRRRCLECSMLNAPTADDCIACGVRLHASLLAEKLNGENHERQTGAPEGNLTT